jgi:hypothetical protein
LRAAPAVAIARCSLEVELVVAIPRFPPPAIARCSRSLEVELLVVVGGLELDVDKNRVRNGGSWFVVRG